MEIRFVFKSTSGKPRVHSKRLPVVVGRCDADDVRLRIPIDSVSRRHCEFFLGDAGKVCLRDLESTNGTLLNGEEIDPRAAAVVTPGSSVKVGTVVFRVDFKPTRHDPDADTIGVDEASEPPSLSTAPTEPLERRGSDDESENDVEMDDDGNAPPSNSDFAFLAAAGSESADEEPEELEADGPPAAGDANLEDFFKGLK